MNEFLVDIGEHVALITCNNEEFETKFNKMYKAIEERRPDLAINIKKGYGVPFTDYDVEVIKENVNITFRRADYLIESSIDYKFATIYAHNDLALKHALMNLYSAFIVYHNWGLMIHSSCAVEKGRGHIFSGHSGAGKSTAAKLSQPRELLSDEATLIKISSDKITVFDSPFRSEIVSLVSHEPVPLASIQLLHQALHNNRVKLGKADAYLEMMDKVFYWAHSKEETLKLMSLLRTLIESVPVYELHFKKDPTFWELIS